MNVKNPPPASLCTGICHHPWKKVQFEAKPAFGGLSHIFFSILMYLLEMLVVGTSVVIVNIDTYEKNRTKGSQTDKQTYQPNVQTNTLHTGMQDRKLMSRFKLFTLHRKKPIEAEWLGTHLDNEHLLIISTCDLLPPNYELLCMRCLKRILKKKSTYLRHQDARLVLWVYLDQHVPFILPACKLGLKPGLV